VKNMPDLKTIARKHALKNAFDYGKADIKSVVGKVLAEFPEAKKDMKTTMSTLAAVISEVNKLKKNEIEKQMSAFTYFEKKQEEKKIVLPNAVAGKVVVRFPPEPNGYPHIGHAKAFFLEWTACREYGGKVILRWDDTNPEAEKEEYVEAIRSGIKWLGMDWDQEVFCSDWLPKLYELNEQLLQQGDAYVCTCKQEEIAANREKMQRCKCGANANIAKNSSLLWKEMLLGKLKKGQAVVRLKGDMASANTVMRDPTLWRIVDAEHYRQGKKFRVWPTYDFQGSVMDSLLGVTHPLRSKEYELRDELYFYLLEKLKLRKPTLITISRLSIANMPVSKRLLKPFVESGKLMGWDDPRLPTLAGLRRRGILPEAIKNFVLSFGLSKVESNPSMDALLAENRKLLDKDAEHYFFVPAAVKIKVSGQVPVKDLKGAAAKNFPFSGNEFYIPAVDTKLLKKGAVVRLKDFAGVKVTSATFAGKNLTGEFVSAPLKEGEKIVQWELLKEDGSFNEKSLEEVKGYCPASAAKLKEGEVVQFERVGFARLDAKTKQGLAKSELVFIYSC